MLTFIIGLLTFVLILNCLLLILLVLVQLPKKDAGAGMAFGGGTADALFGAGSGNVLTKITKYATGVLLVLALLIGHLQATAYTNSNTSGNSFEQMVEQNQMQDKGAPQAPAKPATTPSQPPQAPTTAPTTTLPEAAPAVSNAPAAK